MDQRQVDTILLVSFVVKILSELLAHPLFQLLLRWTQSAFVRRRARSFVLVQYDLGRNKEGSGILQLFQGSAKDFQAFLALHPHFLPHTRYHRRPRVANRTSNMGN